MERDDISEIAKISQKSDLYLGIDPWEKGKVEENQLIVQFDYRRNEDILNQPKTVSNYFGDKQVLDQCVTENGLVDAKKYAELCQVFPRQIDETKGTFMYPENIAVYRVNKSFDCAVSGVQNNPLYGSGGGIQFYTNISKSDLIKENLLELVQVKHTVNRDHSLSFVQEAERNGLPYEEILKTIPQKHRELVNEWLKGTQEQRERAMNIIGMEREYERLMAEREKGMEKQGSEIQQENSMQSPEMESKLPSQDMDNGIEASPMEVSAEKSGIEMEISGGSPSLEIGGEGPSPGMETGGGMEMGME